MVSGDRRYARLYDLEVAPATMKQFQLAGLSGGERQRTICIQPVLMLHLELSEFAVSST
jgi:hypothetical protein